MNLRDEPRANRSFEEIKRRVEALGNPHMLPLTEFVQGLRRRFPEVEFPDFDPLGGGVNSRVLFLLEKPGPKTSRKAGGSGFISACNDDPTADAMWHFMRDAGISNRESIHWNIIPGWDGTRRYFSKDVRGGLPLLAELIELLPLLETVILAGIPARKAVPALEAMGLNVIRSDHPGLMVRARYPERWRNIATIWREGISDPK